MASGLEVLTLIPTTSHSGYNPIAQHGANALITRLFYIFIFMAVLCHGHIRAGPLSMTSVESTAAVFTFIDFSPAMCLHGAVVMMVAF